MREGIAFHPAHSEPGLLPELSIFIGTLNRLDLLKACYERICLTTEISWELFISDAGSTDGTLKFLGGLKEPKLRVITHRKKIGQAQSINQVLKMANGRYFCWLSDDNILAGNGLLKAVTILRKDPSIGLVGLKVRDMEGPFKSEAYIGGISPAGVLNVNQGVTRTELARRLGGFCVVLKDYGIDPDFTTKVVLSGAKVVMTKKVEILHFRDWGSKTAYRIIADKQERFLKLYSRRYAHLTREYQRWKRLPKKQSLLLLRILIGLHPLCQARNTLKRDLHNFYYGRFISFWDPWKCLFRNYHFVQKLPRKRTKAISPSQKIPSASTGVRTAIFGQLLPDSAGGIGSNLLELIKALATKNGPGDFQMILGPGGESAWLHPWCGALQEAYPAPIYDARQAFLWEKKYRNLRGILRKLAARFFRKRLGWVQTSLNLEKILAAHRTEVIHFPYQRLFSTRVPSIFEPWDLQHRHLPENFSREEIEFRDWLYRRGCYGANVVVTATHWTKQDLVRTYAVPPEKIAVVYRGAPQFSAFQIRSYGNTLTGQNRLGIRTPYLIYPAKTWPHKNHVRLFQAMAVLKNMGQDVSLVCTGTVLKINRDSLENLIAELGLKSSIHLVDHLPDGEFLPLLKQARGLVFPSLFEGLGIPVLEAMALGVPVACSEAACLPEVCGEAALLFDPLSPQSIADAIHALWKDSYLRQKLRTRGRVQAAKFSWNEAAGNFRLLYRYLAKGELMPHEVIILKSLFS